MRINHNISSINANRVLKFKHKDVNESMRALSSGMRINRAGDDASGLAVSEKMRAQIRGLKQAERNAEDGISFIQTTEGYLQETQDILQRIRELSVQSANGIYTNTDRMYIQVEVSQLVDEVDRIANTAQFNKLNMLTGRFSQDAGPQSEREMWFHIGANMNEREQVFIGTMTAQALGIRDSSSQIMTLSSAADANKAIGDLDEALKTVSKQRADLGAYQNRLEKTVEGISIGYENIQAAESRIRDADMAEFMVEFTKDQILVQSGTAMLAQANQKSQSVLQLLR